MTNRERIEEANREGARRWMREVQFLAGLYLALGHPAAGTIDCLVSLVCAQQSSLGGAAS